LCRYDGCAPLPHSHARIAAAFPRLARLQVVGPYWLAARDVQLFLDRVPTLRVFELRRGRDLMRSGATEALKSVWLPPTLCEYRDYVGAATVCVGAARDARHDTRCRDCGHGVSCNCGDGVVQDKENIGTATVAAVAVSDPHLSPLPPLSTATEYALQLLHLSRGARVENPLSDVPRLAHLADVYYSQSSALAHAMRLEERRREWEHYHALMRHPSLTRLHCTPIRVHESRDENFDGRDDSDSEDDEEVGGGGVAESETPTAKHARWVQYVAGLPPPPATRSRLERLSLQFHPKVRWTVFAYLSYVGVRVYFSPVTNVHTHTLRERVCAVPPNTHTHARSTTTIFADPFRLPTNTLAYRCRPRWMSGCLHISAICASTREARTTRTSTP
jgi:hypothetical protein